MRTTIKIDFSDTRFRQVGFKSDGKRMLSATGEILNQPWCKPARLPKSVCRLLIRTFLEKGYTVHSNLMSTAWVVIEYCKVKGIDFHIDLDNFTIRRI